MKILCSHNSVLKFEIVFLLIFLSTTSKSFGYIQSSENPLQKLNDFDPDIEPYDEHKKVEKYIFGYQKNGVKLDVKVVPKENDSISEQDENFPIIPFKDLGLCIINLSLTCVKDRIASYIDRIGQLKQITLFGNTVKLIKVRQLPRRAFLSRSIDINNRIDQSIDNFFDKFALRITLPKGDGKKEKNQIDLMFDDFGINNARGKGGMGGGGGKGGKGCKHMMMCMMMALKMKMIGMMGLMAMKGLMMAGASMMMTKAMLVMKMMSMKGGGGPWMKGGGGGGGSYGPPPPPPPPPPSSSYGPPSISGGGGGGYDYSGGGGGGGWGRSFENRLSMKNHRNIDDYSNSQQTVDSMSIVHPYPERKDETNINNHWIPKHYINSDGRDMQINDDHIGEVHEEINEPKASDDLMPETDKKVIDGANYIHNYNNYEYKKGVMDLRKFNESNIIYAKYWKNYEPADRIWDIEKPIAINTNNSK